MKWTAEVSENADEMDIYDHNEHHVTTVENDGSGFGKQDVRNIALEHMEEDKPSAYNQKLIACMACDKIQIKQLGQEEES